MSRKNNNGLCEYLEKLGILETGSDEEIKAVKKAYRKEYLLKYKRNQRAKKPEFTINFSNENGEYHRMEYAAKKHKLTIPSFIKKAALAYIEKKFIVPNIDQVVSLEQILSRCLNEIQAISGKKDKFFWDKERKYEQLEKRLEKLEAEIFLVFRNPPLLKDSTIYDYQNQNV